MDDGNYYMCQWDDTTTPNRCYRVKDECLPDFEGDTGIPYCSAVVWQVGYNLGASSAGVLPYCYCRSDYSGTNHVSSSGTHISRCIPSPS